MLYAVYLEDTNGCRRLVGGGLNLSEADAKALIEKTVAKHTKPHKVDYYMIGYTPETRSAVLASNNITI